MDSKMMAEYLRNNMDNRDSLDDIKMLLGKICSLLERQVEMDNKTV